MTVAAVWFGSAVFFSLFVGPAFFTDEMKRLFPPPYNGAIAELVLSRYFVLHYICGVLALVHLVERLRAGGFILLDTQFMTEHLRRFGAVEIPRREYQRQLQSALLTPARF